MTIGRLALALLLIVPAPVSAEWQIKPFLGVMFGGETTVVDLEQAAGSPNVVFGVSGLLVGDVVGIEGDFGYGPGFFQAGDQHLVTQSSVTTLTASILVTLPRRLTEYTLRPYVVGGAGLMHARIKHTLDVLRVATTLPAVDFGGGVTGFLTDRIGLSWELRRIQSIGRRTERRGVSIGREQLSFWRANMALAIRY